MNFVNSNGLIHLYLDDLKQVELNASIKSKFRIISWLKFLTTISGYPLFNTVNLQCCPWNCCKYFCTVLIATVFILNAVVIFSPDYNRCPEIFIVVLLFQVQGLALFSITYLRIMPKLYVSADDNSDSYSNGKTLQQIQQKTIVSRKNNCEARSIDGQAVSNDTDPDIDISSSALNHFVEKRPQKIQNPFNRMLDSPISGDVDCSVYTNCSLINNESGNDYNSYEITLSHKNNNSNNNCDNQIDHELDIDEEIEHNYNVVARLKYELIICICLVSIVWITGFPYLAYFEFNNDNISSYDFDDFDVTLMVNVITNILDGFRYESTFEHEFKKEILIKYNLYQFYHFKQITDSKKLYQILCNNNLNAAKKKRKKRKRKTKKKKKQIQKEKIQVIRNDRTTLRMYFAIDTVQY